MGVPGSGVRAGWAWSGYEFAESLDIGGDFLDGALHGLVTMCVEAGEDPSADEAGRRHVHAAGQALDLGQVLGGKAGGHGERLIRSGENSLWRHRLVGGGVGFGGNL